MEPVKLWKLWKRFEGEDLGGFFDLSMRQVCIDLNKQLGKIDMTDISDFEEFKKTYPKMEEAIRLFDVLEFLTGPDRYMTCGAAVIRNDARNS